MPEHQRHIVRKAQAEDWKSRPRKGRGGGREYHVSSLPEAARVELARRAATSSSGEQGTADAARVEIRRKLDERAIEARRQEALALLPTLPESDRARLSARMEMLVRVDAVMTSAALALRPACEFVEQGYADGTLDVDAAVRAVIGESVSWRTLMRWHQALEQKGVSSLAGSYGRRSARVYLSKIEEDEEVHQYVLGQIVHSPHVSARHVEQGIRARFGRDRTPHVRTIQAFLERWKSGHASLYERIANPDGWRSRRRAAFGSASEEIVRLNQRWEFDSTPADVALSDGSRHTIIGVIDVYSRRLRLLVSRTSRSTAIAALARRALIEWGVPEEIKTDNGTDYVSNYQREVWRALNVRHIVCNPFSPWEKPHVERALGTFSHDLVELLSGYVGHSVADAQALRSQKSFAERMMTAGETVEIRMSAAELQDFCDRWCTDVYGHNVHEGLGKSPFQMAAAWREPTRRITDERALDVLLQTAPGDGRRTVQKKGIQVDGRFYIHGDLGEHVGDTVLVRYDEADMGRIYVFSGSHEFICIAECPELTGISRAEVAAAARQSQKRILGGVAELRKIARRVKPHTVVDDVLAERKAAADGLRLIERPAIEHTTPELEEALKAADARAGIQTGPRPVTLTDEQREQAARFRAEQEERRRLQEEEEQLMMQRAKALLAEQQQPARYYDDEFDRYRDLKRREQGGEILSEEDAAFLAETRSKLSLSASG